MAKWIDLVKEYFPNISDDEAAHMLWEQTGFPCFWSIPEDGNTPEACCRKQLQKFKEEREDATTKV